MVVTTMLALIASGCSSIGEDATPEPKPVRAADPRCNSSETGTFYAQNATFTDPDALDLAESTPVAEDLDPDLLQRASTEVGRTGAALSFLVMRHGKLVWERYFNGSKATHAENIHSAAKSLLSLVVGRAIEEGKLELDDRIDEHLPPEAVPSNGDLTVKDLLTMSAGLRWEENVTEEGFDQDGSFVRQILELEREDEPGEKFDYNTGLTQVLSAVVAEATGRSTCAFAHEELLSPIGVSVEHWLSDADGYHAGGHSTFITPRELARIGQLVLDDGEELVSNDWLRTSLAKTWDVGCRTPAEHASYGYLWWRSMIGTTTVWAARGFGGQSLFIVPSLDMVVVLTNDTNESHTDVVEPNQLLSNFLMPAAGLEVENDTECAGFDLYRVDIDGTGMVQLTDLPSMDLWAAPSPDGRSIAFATTRDANWEIYVMKVDGTRPRRLTTHVQMDSFPAFSPDGSLIAFTRDGPDDEGLYTIERDGSGELRLTQGPDIGPSWSPDGHQIAFSRHAETPEQSDTLWIIDADAGSEANRIAERIEGIRGVRPTFSPDGRRIAYYDNKELIRTANVDGSDEVVIGKGRQPHYLPDGSLVFAADGGRDKTWRIVRWDDGDITTIVDTPGDDLVPIPSADGEWLTFAAAPKSAAGGSGAEKR